MENEFEVGYKVRAILNFEKSNIIRNSYPAKGTVGTIQAIRSNVNKQKYLLIQWPKKSMPENRTWWTNSQWIEKVEK